MMINEDVKNYIAIHASRIFAEAMKEYSKERWFVKKKLFVYQFRRKEFDLSLWHLLSKPVNHMSFTYLLEREGLRKLEDMILENVKKGYNDFHIVVYIPDEFADEKD